uniref:Ribosomal protein L5 n=1 Tax=Storeatula sp. CCMP1868 TaxID=195070 RepID=A0A2P1G8F3_9CRYP|nr:ribosomal protein L5 [Storeatula sp. CCMP1868]AVM81166.1 ribosomal protein L5 [Storeatula sp. CCMP1868]
MKNTQKWIKNIISKDLIYKKCFKNNFQFPILKDIRLTMNSKNVIQNSRNIFFCFAILEVLSNQTPKVCLARKSISNFKIQKNMPLACMITLRRDKKELFFQLFLAFLLPRLQLRLDKNVCSTNIGIKTLLFIPQFTIINNYSLDNFGFNITFNYNVKDFFLILSGLQLEIHNEKT